MKKILYILLIGLFSACDSLLDVEPETLVSFDNYYKTEQDLEISLYQLQSFIHGRLLEQNVQERAGFISEYNWTQEHFWDPSTMVGMKGQGEVCTLWDQTYWVVYMANVLLDNMYKAEANVSPERMNYYRAQAYFGKALGYFFLGRRWGEVPITRNSSSSEVYGKRPLLEVLDTVIANAERAYKMLPVQADLVDRTGTPITSKQFGSKGSACALLAHAYAWKGSMIDLMGLDGNSNECYKKSVEYANYLIKGDAGNYSLVRDPEELCKYFSDYQANNPESIFEFSLDMSAEIILSTYLIGKEFIGYPVNPSTKAGDQQYKSSKISYSTIRTLYDTLDLRRDAYFHRYSYYSTDSVQFMFTDMTEVVMKHLQDSVRKEITELTGGVAYPFKWREGVYEADPYNPGTMQLIAIKSNYSYWRLSDIYLLRAECYVKLGEEGLAQADLNEIREINNVKSYPNSGGDEKGLKYAIFHERERELLMEGHRFYDAVRNGMEYINTYLPGALKTLTLTDVKNGALFFPIHESAFKMNGLLRQNVYWAPYMRK